MNNQTTDRRHNTLGTLLLVYALYLDAVEDFSQRLSALLDLGAFIVADFLVEDRSDSSFTDHYGQTDVDLFFNALVTLHSCQQPVDSINTTQVSK